MGLFTTKYKVEHNTDTIFEKWDVVLKNVSQKEAEKYIKDKTGFMKEKNLNIE